MCRVEGDVMMMCQPPIEINAKLLYHFANEIIEFVADHQEIETTKHVQNRYNYICCPIREGFRTLMDGHAHIQ